tara:strand:- start:319 stop:1200 length:882 start_codon:yes stop_codon:yes gene_type:complete
MVTVSVDTKKFNRLNDIEEKDVINEKISNVMSIEEYRNLKFTPEQEWNNTYNPKKISIEALEIIEIKKRGAGPLKNIYRSNILEGPVYDPLCAHIHIWKPKNSIKNFIGEQFQNSPHVQYTNNKSGLYCSICHIRNIHYKFNWGESIDKKFTEDFISSKNRMCKFIEKTTVIEKRSDEIVSTGDKIVSTGDKIVSTGDKIVSTGDEIVSTGDEIVSTGDKVLNKWKKILYKVNYSLYNKKIEYTISKFKTLYLWPWQLTHYQKFKLNNKNYRDNCVFIKSDLEKFKEYYYTIS